MSRVLIIEDEAAYGQILKDSFEKEKFEVVVFSDVRQAIAEIDKNRPDVILLDIMLPGGMNGFDLLEKIKANKLTKNIPVIVVTNLGSEEKVAREIGADFYFIKTETTIDQIIKKVKQLI